MEHQVIGDWGFGALSVTHERSLHLFHSHPFRVTWRTSKLGKQLEVWLSGTRRRLIPPSFGGVTNMLYYVQSRSMKAAELNRSAWNQSLTSALDMDRAVSMNAAASFAVVAFRFTASTISVLLTDAPLRVHTSGILVGTWKLICQRQSAKCKEQR
jgi:hypothetical protein